MWDPNPKPLGLAEALARLAEGPDREAWGALAAESGPALWSLARRLTGDDALADDIVQETLLQVRRHAARFRARPADRDGSARAWLLHVCANVALKLQRSERRREKRERAAASVPSQCEPAQAVLREEVASLPENLRTPLVLRYFGGLDYAQVAAQLGLREAAARKRVQRALERLRARLAATALLPPAAGAWPIACVSKVGVPAAAAARVARWAASGEASAAPALEAVVPESAKGVGIMFKIGIGSAASAALAACVALSLSAPSQASEGGRVERRESHVFNGREVGREEFERLQAEARKRFEAFKDRMDLEGGARASSSISSVTAGSGASKHVFNGREVSAEEYERLKDEAFKRFEDLKRAAGDRQVHDTNARVASSTSAATAGPGESTYVYNDREVSRGEFERLTRAAFQQVMDLARHP
ncbi:MAG: sigma-70 family RNA polymerase sigma factor [Planctomycetota bacterium]|nr:sigma-70 family RNA polymerase sigma factor [Planctomycetota bacterium]